jgi:CDP-diacylglycerol--glycerol-3-phosphate 3-phosphatidyltransferase
MPLGRGVGKPGTLNSGKAALLWREPYIHPRAFATHANATISAFQRSWREMKRGKRIDIDTWIWPMIQGGVLGIQEEEQGVEKVLRAARDMATAKSEGYAQHGVMVDLTSGYFGLYKKYKESLLQSQAPYRVVAASPEVSVRGFDDTRQLTQILFDSFRPMGSTSRKVYHI